MNSEITICFFAFPASVHSVLLLPYFTLLTLIQSSCLDSLPLILQLMRPTTLKSKEIPISPVTTPLLVFTLLLNPTLKPLISFLTCSLFFPKLQRFVLIFLNFNDSKSSNLTPPLPRSTV
ncbi:uncharacterized protein LOC130808145 isoform X1 [Amaranthus tricolor]|uniref:uncharacterized protein LOC130808145 isoform X1 n=1 Tax=Amaranthus tricolor TaxID=29722 RepID=UPI0025860D86|nr:uncharacterized protein LOC130808145 isoform X1 [Amaranthus tricolor]